MYGNFAETWGVFGKVILPGMVIGGGAGLGIAMMQWRILRQQIAKAGWWWILANATGWAMALLVSRGVSLQVQNNIGVILSGVLGGVVVGTITGIILYWLLQYLTESQSGES